MAPVMAARPSASQLIGYVDCTSRKALGEKNKNKKASTLQWGEAFHTGDLGPSEIPPTPTRGQNCPTLPKLWELTKGWREGMHVPGLWTHTANG